MNGDRRRFPVFKSDSGLGKSVQFVCGGSLGKVTAFARVPEAWAENP